MLLWLRCWMHSIVGVVTLLFERYLGQKRGPIRFPLRGLVYIAAGVFPFYSEPTMIIGAFYMVSGVTNCVAVWFNEVYDAPPKVESAKVEESALQSDGVWDALVQLAVMFREQNKIGVMCFIVFYICANIALFAYTVTSMPPSRHPFIHLALATNRSFCSWFCFLLGWCDCVLCGGGDD